jgi:hypothetical protein
MKNSEFARGVQAAADVAAEYNSSTSHPYRLDDCILCKLNVVSRKRPRKNLVKLDTREDTWTQGYVVALAEMHRYGHHTSAVVQAAKAAGITLDKARKAGAVAFDLRELKRAGVPR